jgi:hypothetical protein
MPTLTCLMPNGVHAKRTEGCSLFVNRHSLIGALNESDVKRRCTAPMKAGFEQNTYLPMIITDHEVVDQAQSLSG